MFLHRQVLFSTRLGTYLVGWNSRNVARMSTSAAENSIHGHSTGRWLYNDIQQRALRYTPFDVEALKKVTCQSVGATQCINFTKIGEGSYNKIFLLELDNGVKATARIPGPVVGNLKLSTASEAATLSYLSESNLAKVPRLLTWNASIEDNPVKWPFIVTEYIPGIPLQDIWSKIRGDPVAFAIVRIITTELLVSRPEFSQIGSLYFKHDVSPELQSRPLFKAEEDNVDDPNDISQRYRIGPITDREWWRGARLDIEADRGPWPDTASYITAAARLEQQCISQGVDLHSPYVLSCQDDIPNTLALLEQCAAVAPHLAPDDPILVGASLAHPDLSASNLIVPENHDTKKIKVIDWQGTIVAPFFMQSMIPSAVAYTAGVIQIPPDGSLPLFPDDLDQRSKEDQEYIRLHHTLACRQRLFVEKLGEYDPKYLLAWSLSHWDVMCWLILHISRCWAGGQLELRNDLISLADRWTDISPSPCPLHFTADERAEHEARYAAHTHYRERVRLLRNYIGCDTNGWVPNDMFDEACEKVEEVRQVWNAEEEKGPFPFEEGSYSYFLT